MAETHSEFCARMGEALVRVEWDGGLVEVGTVEPGVLEEAIRMGFLERERWIVRLTDYGRAQLEVGT